MEIIPVPCLTDNYAYIVRAGDEAVVVDPSETLPIAEAIQSLGLDVRAVLCTHHHVDHVGGLPGLLSRFGADLPVYGHERDAARIAGLNRPVRDGAAIEAAGMRFDVLHVPAHTLGAVGYVLPGRAVFSGDTLFVAGCGRLFEGTAAFMHRALYFGFGRLADDIAVYPGHEYAEKNLRFALSVEPSNNAIKSRLEHVRERRHAGLFCVPSSLGEERATNPFMRVSTPEVRAFAKQRGANERDPVSVLAAVRAARDQY